RAAGQRGVALAQGGGVEEGRDGIAAELEQAAALHIAAVAVDLLDKRAEETVDDRRDLLCPLFAERAELLGERGKAREVGEQHRAIPVGAADTAGRGPGQLLTDDGRGDIGGDRDRKSTRL